MVFTAILDEAMYAKQKITVFTKERGKIIGIPYCVDEYDSDPERLGYCLQTGKHEEDTVYLDEIIEINNKTDIQSLRGACDEAIQLKTVCFAPGNRKNYQGVNEE